MKFFLTPPLKGAAIKAEFPEAKVRYGLIGLGHIAQTAVLPAFSHARENSQCVAVISSDREKLVRLGKRYGVPQLYLDSQLETCLRGGDIDALYIATPHSEHRRIAEVASKYGIHVLCEKPIVLAARNSRTHLMIAYWLHFEAANLAAIKAVKDQSIGKLKIFSSIFSVPFKDSSNIRLRRETGGGTLWDLGIYCINAARSLFQSEPIEVFAMAANGGERRFREVDAITSVVMRFPGDRLAPFSSSFSGFDSSVYDLIGTEGRIHAERAYDYSTPMEIQIIRDGKKTVKKYPRRDQFAPEIIYFLKCIRQNKRPDPSGEEGLADVKIIEALLKSIRMGRPIKISVSTQRNPPRAERHNEVSLIDLSTVNATKRSQYANRQSK